MNNQPQSSAKLRVVHIAEDLNTGGLEHGIETLSASIDKSKIDMEVWGLVSGGEIARSLMSAGVPVRILSVRSCYNLLDIAKTTRLLDQTRPSVVHTHSYFANTIGRISAALAGVPVKIVHHHSTFHDYSRTNVLIDRFLNRFTDKIIYVSEGVQRSFAGAGYDNSKTMVIHNGINPRPFNLPPLPRTRKVIVIVASLTTHKGHRFLIEAMKQVITRVPDALLWIVGEGPLRTALEEQAAQLGIGGNVRFWGQRTDVPEILAQATLGALASTREGLPLSIIEYMASGLPVVAPAISGVPEVVAEGVTGLLFPSGDSLALANAILSLLSDPERAAMMGRKGRELFEQSFTGERMASDIMAVYGQLIAKRAGKRKSFA